MLGMYNLSHTVMVLYSISIFFLVIIQAFQHSSWLYVISVKHRYQTIKWFFKNSYFCTETFQPKKLKRASIPQIAFKNK